MTHRSRLSDAVWTAFTEAIRFVVVPLVLIDLVTTNYPLLTTPFLPYIRQYVLFFGGMIVAASMLEAINRPGTFKRLLFGLGALAFLCMWLFVVFGGGVAEFTYGPYHVRFDLTKLVYIMLVGISLKGLLVIETYRTHKRLLAEEAAQKRKEELEIKRAATRARKAARADIRSPSLSSMSKVAYEVTPDSSVGYAPPPPPPGLDQEQAAAPPPPPPEPEVPVRYKTCPICGERAKSTDYICQNCGAWFSRESFRFAKEPSGKR